jgi:hypothetical protein
MNKSTYFAAVMLLTALLAAAGHVTAQNKIEILRTGQFHGNEVTAATGEAWYGIFEVSGKFTLKQTTITVDTIADPIMDDQSGKQVSTSEKNDPLVLIKGIDLIETDSLPCSFSGKEFIHPGEDLNLGQYGQDYYSLTALGAYEMQNPKYPRDGLFTDYRILLSASGVIQTIASFDRLGTDGVPRLLWAGDLDHDRKPDLIMELTDHYNVSVTALFLSSQSKGDNLVSKVAVFRTVGC